MCWIIVHVLTSYSYLTAMLQWRIFKQHFWNRFLSMLNDHFDFYQERDHKTRRGPKEQNPWAGTKVTENKSINLQGTCSRFKPIWRVVTLQYVQSTYCRSLRPFHSWLRLLSLHNLSPHWADGLRDEEAWLMESSNDDNGSMDDVS